MTAPEPVVLTDGEREALGSSGSWPHVGRDIFAAVERILADRLAAANIAGQMQHITAEMVRGDQPLEAKEEFIADLRARLSHVEAERDESYEDGYQAGLREGEARAETRDESFDVLADRLAADRAAHEALREAIEGLADEWERRCDAVAITYQAPDARHQATAGGRRFVADLRAALAAAAPTPPQDAATEGGL